MSGTSVVLLVVGILVLQILIWIPVLLWIRRKSDRLIADLDRELAAAGERVVLGPAHASYRGATAGAGLPFAKGNAIAALTDRRIIIRRLVGAGVEIPVADIAAVRDDKWFLRSYASGHMTLIIKLRNDAEVGLLVKDHPAWMTALRAHLGDAAASPR